MTNNNEKVNISLDENTNSLNANWENIKISDNIEKFIKETLKEKLVFTMSKTDLADLKNSIWNEAKTKEIISKNITNTASNNTETSANKQSPTENVSTDKSKKTNESKLATIQSLIDNPENILKKWWLAVLFSDFSSSKKKKEKWFMNFFSWIKNTFTKLEIAFSAIMYKFVPRFAEMLWIDKPETKIWELKNLLWLDAVAEKVEESVKTLEDNKNKIIETAEKVTYQEKLNWFFYLFRGSNDIKNKENLKIINTNLEKDIMNKCWDSFGDVTLSNLEKNKKWVIDNIYKNYTPNKELLSKKPNNITNEIYIKKHINLFLSSFIWWTDWNDKISSWKTILEKYRSTIKNPETLKMREYITNCKFLKDLSVFNDPINLVKNPWDIAAWAFSNKLADLTKDNLQNLDIEKLKQYWEMIPESLQKWSDLAIVTLEIKSSSKEHKIDLNTWKVKYNKNNLSNFENNANLTKNFIETKLAPFAKEFKINAQKHDTEWFLNWDVSIKDIYTMYLICWWKTNINELTPVQQTTLFATMGWLKTTNWSTENIWAATNQFIQKIINNFDSFIDKIPNVVKITFMWILKAVWNWMCLAWKVAKEFASWIFEDAIKNKNYAWSIILTWLAALFIFAPTWTPKVSLYSQVKKVL